MLNGVSGCRFDIIADTFDKPGSLGLQNPISLFIAAVLCKIVELCWIICKKLLLFFCNGEQRKGNDMKNAIVAMFKLPTEKFYQKNDDPYKLNDEVLVNFTVRFKGNINANRIDYACSLG